MNAPVTNLPAKVETKRSVLVEMSTRFGMEPKAFSDTLCATVFPKEGSNEEFLAFLLVAKEYDLNPLTKEIYAFPKKGGGIQPIVSVDGWLNIINSHPQCNGIEFDDHVEGNAVVAITCRIWRKDRDKPIMVTEYLAECVRPTDPWKQYPRRMLRHKALIQCARYAFGFAGIVDPDEAERIGVATTTMRDVTPRDDGPPPPPASKVITHQVRGDAPQDARGDAPATEPETAGDAFDEAQWLKDLDGALSSCEDVVTLGQKQNEVMKPMKGKVSPENWKAAEKLMRDHFARLNSTALDAG